MRRLLERFFPRKMGGIELCPGERPRALFLNTYYPKFIDAYYKAHFGLESTSYSEQLLALQSECFGDSDFYSEGLKKAGWEASDLIVNCAPLQASWAKEQGFGGNGLAIALEQIKRNKPHVVYIQDFNLAKRSFLSAIRPYTGLIVGQIASPVPRSAHLRGMDIIFTSFPHFVDRFRKMGIASYYCPLAFEPRVLDKLSPSERIHPVTFIGGLSRVHSKGTLFLEHLVRQIPLELWGYGVESVASDSTIRSHHHGEAWGLAMFDLFHRSNITLNRHIDVAEDYANNMRLFEATGCGSLLITDEKKNLNELFAIGKEIVTYRTPEECAEKVRYYMDHPEEALAIAQAGQARTLREHTYAQRMEKTAEILGRHLRYRREKPLYANLDMSKISWGHTPIEAAEVQMRHTTAWKDKSVPPKQRALVQRELEEMYRGKVPRVYQVLADCIRPISRVGGKILEIGCASGYYYESLEYLLSRRLCYTGVDYSDALIAMARDFYPKAEFIVADGAALPFPDGSFEIAISSCVLLHVPNYPEHIAETARVAKDWVIAHRTPIRRTHQTTYLSKQAYGVETVELHYNEQEFLSRFKENGLKLAKTIEFGANPQEDNYQITYLFSKGAR